MRAVWRPERELPGSRMHAGPRTRYRTPGSAPAKSQLASWYNDVRIYTVVGPATEPSILFLGTDLGMVAIGATDPNDFALQHARTSIRSLGGRPRIAEVPLLAFIDAVIGRNPTDLLVVNGKEMPVSVRTHYHFFPPREDEVLLDELAMRQRALYNLTCLLIGTSRPTCQDRAVQERLDRGESVRLSGEPAHTERFLVEVRMPSGNLGLNHVAPLLVQNETGTIRWLYVDAFVSILIMEQLDGAESGHFYARETVDQNGTIRLWIDTSELVSISEGTKYPQPC